MGKITAQDHLFWGAKVAANRDVIGENDGASSKMRVIYRALCSKKGLDKQLPWLDPEEKRAQGNEQATNAPSSYKQMSHGFVA